MRRTRFVQLAALFLALGLVGAVCGCGCYDTAVSDLTMEPPTPCLDLHLPATVSNCGGSHLVISGTNNCDATLIIPGTYRKYAYAGQDLVAPPGATVSYDMGSAVTSGTQHYDIVCEIGDATVVLSFTGP